MIWLRRLQSLDRPSDYEPRRQAGSRLVCVRRLFLLVNCGRVVVRVIRSIRLADFLALILVLVLAPRLVLAVLLAVDLFLALTPGILNLLVALRSRVS